MLRVIIVEDEPEAATHLMNQLGKCSSALRVAGICRSVKEAVKTIPAENPDLVFMDIELPDGNGFDVVTQLQHLALKVVFTTGHNGYAIKAFRHNAIDYLLKPVREEELREAIEKAKVPFEDEVTHRKKMELMIQSLKISDFSKIVIPSMDSFEFLDKKDIILCSAESNYTYITTTGQPQLITTYLLKKVEELLTEPNFFRVHKSFLININFVRKLNKGENGTVVMQNGTEVPLSRRKREEFLSLLGVK
ncbi:MAG: LytTR family DNA-binding domain-containing protein [Chitinophagales bacterium]